MAIVAFDQGAEGRGHQGGGSGGRSGSSSTTTETCPTGQILDPTTNQCVLEGGTQREDPGSWNIWEGLNIDLDLLDFNKGYPLTTGDDDTLTTEDDDTLTTEDDQVCEEPTPISCVAGGCASTLAECGNIYTDYDEDIGYDAEGQFIDDTSTEEREDLRDIYEAMGGKEWTGLGFQEWVDTYGDTFPAWEGSQYEKQSNLLEAQLGLLDPALDLKMESFDFQRDQSRYGANVELEDTRLAREALIRAGGGIQTGQMEERVDTAYDRVLKGFDYEQGKIDMEREASLIDFEGKRLTYEFDLSKVVSDFQENMWSLIAANKEIQSGGACEDSGDCGDDQNCYDGRCQPTLDYSDTTLEDPQALILSGEYDAKYDYNNDGVLNVLDLVIYNSGEGEGQEETEKDQGCPDCYMYKNIRSNESSCVRVDNKFISCAERCC